MHPTKPPPIDLHPVLTRLLDFPQDPMTSTELAQILGVNRATISDAFTQGVIANTASCLRRDGKPDYARRTATKAAVIVWLWKSQQGDRSLLEQALKERAPKVLAMLLRQEATTAAPRLPLPANVTPFPRPDKPVQTELQLFPRIA